MKKNYIITILVACLMATSFFSAEAEENPNLLLLNSNHFGKNPNYGANAVFSQYDEASSVMAPKRRKSKRRKGGRRGGSDLAFEKGKMAIDIGAGMPFMTTGYESEFPAIFVGFEYGVWNGTSWAFGIGVYGGYTASSYDPFAAFSGIPGAGGAGSTAPDVKFVNKNLLIGAKGSLHYNFSSKFEAYWSLIVGYRSVSTELTGEDADGFSEDGFPGISLAVSGVFPSSVLGLKYYIVDNFGLFLEGGYGVTTVGGGISLKF